MLFFEVSSAPWDKIWRNLNKFKRCNRVIGKLVESGTAEASRRRDPREHPEMSTSAASRFLEAPVMAS